MVKINGQNEDVKGQTVADYLALKGFNKARVAVELNGDILPKSKYGETVLCDGDEIEIVSFVGGG